MSDDDREKVSLIYAKWRRAVVLFSRGRAGLHIFATETYFATRKLAGYEIEKGETDKDIYPFADVKRAVAVIRGKKLSNSKAYREIEKSLLDEGGIDVVMRKNDPEYETFVMKLLAQVDGVLKKFADSEILADREALNVYREISSEIHRRQIIHGLELGPSG